MSRGSGRVEGGRPAHPRRGGKLLALWRAHARRRHLSACSGESRQLTGTRPAQCWAGQWAARWAGPGKWLDPFSLSFFLFFYYFCNFGALLKMPGHFQKS